MVKAFTDEDEALLAELGVEAEPQAGSSRTHREERIIAGFEEIQRFYERNGRLPQHGEDRDIFERLYAVRLDRLRVQADCRAVLDPLDHQGLLGGAEAALADPADEMSDDELLAELGVEAEPEDEITDMRHVRSAADRRAAKDVANRDKCEDFDRFKPLFEQVQRDIESGLRQTRPFELKAEIRQGSWFIVGGQKAYVAAAGETYTNAQGRTDARLRVIFDNGTESNLLMRSLQRALNKDEAGRRITDPVAGPLFTGTPSDDDQASGIIYVLRSKSDHAVVAANRDLVHKIGVTNMDVAKRVAGARLQPTFLMADVEIVATYKLYNIGRTRLENLIHRIFEPARLDIQIKDRFGNPVIPREWFLVPLFAIDEAIEKIKDGTITNYIYDPRAAGLVERKNRA